LDQAAGPAARLSLVISAQDATWDLTGALT